MGWRFGNHGVFSYGDYMTHLKALEKVLDSLVVKSLANGNMLVEIKYITNEPVGVMTRMGIAEEIGELIYEHIGKIRYKRKRS